MRNSSDAEALGGSPVVTGVEQEYGLVLVDDPGQADPTHLANALIRAYVDDTATSQVGFDFSAEAPLSDQWGFQLSRGKADDDLLTDENPMANRVLTNGARFYVDHAHPEYSSPEVTRVADAVAYDRAGDLIMQAASDALAERTGHRIRLFKNTTDGKGQSYGAHENYLLPRALDFDAIVADFPSYLATRGLISGAGRVGIGAAGERPGFQLCQRADFFERLVGLETTVRRPLINTRDEPHAHPRRWRRLHVITGDANLSQYAVWLKLGGAALSLAAITAGVAPAIRLADPVAALRQTSHDLTLRAPLVDTDGTTWTALAIQRAWVDAAAATIERHEVLPGEATEIIEEWSRTLDDLATDPTLTADRLDWAAKKRLCDGYADRDQLPWDHPRLSALDLQYADIDPSRGVALKLEAAGRLRRVVDPQRVRDAVVSPPITTRAATRGALLSALGERVRSIGWESAVIESDDAHMTTVSLGDPLAVPRADLRAALDRGDANATIAALRAARADAVE